jgi:hypothetical protein
MVGTLVTDRAATPEEIGRLEEAGITVVTV